MSFWLRATLRVSCASNSLLSARSASICSLPMPLSTISVPALLRPASLSCMVSASSDRRVSASACSLASTSWGWGSLP